MFDFFFTRKPWKAQKKLFFQGFCFLVAVASLVLCDQASKAWALLNLQTPCYVTPFFSLVCVQNTGIVFGFLASYASLQFFFGFFSLFTSLFFIVFYIFSSSFWTKAGLVFIIGGAFGNAIDRFFRGFVVDFLCFHWGDWVFPVFNLADSFITIGAFFVIVFHHKKNTHSSPCNM